MDIVWGYVLVFILAALPFFEVVGVVPLGILSGLHPVTTAVIGFVGNFLTVLLLIVFVDRFKAWWLKRKEEKHDEKGEKKTTWLQSNANWNYCSGIIAAITAMQMLDINLINKRRCHYAQSIVNIEALFKHLLNTDCISIIN